MSDLTLANRIWPQAGSSNLVRNVVLAVAGSLFVAGAAQVIVPMWPVPMTLQTLAVLSVGAAYGARLGAGTLLLYIVEGAVGLPFFKGGKWGLHEDSLAYWFPSSSLGYLIGFVIAAWLVGKLVDSGWANTMLKSVLATLAGATILYVPGLIWLAIWASSTGVVPEGQTAAQAAIAWGFTPFLFGDALKAIIAGLAVPAAVMSLGRKK
jgi:biotin transport system substrate-specific component